MQRIILLIISAICIPLAGNWAQSSGEDPVLFTVAGKPVTVSEFDYIYTKTNRDKADYSKKSLEEYLDLYIRFKLKVQRARDMGLDTIPALQQELEGYRRQLAKSYLIDRSVTDQLLREAYERMQEDVHVSHILFKLSQEAVDTTAAYQRAQKAMARLKAGKDFEDLARELSEDTGSKNNGGQLGFVTALLPDGFYALESLIYKLEPGKVGGPVRSKLGYHIVRVNTKRPARGQIEAAHLMIRKKKDRPDDSKAKIDSLYEMLENGAEFGELAKAHSEDKRTAPKEGYIGFFGINQLERGLEEAAFALRSDGAYSRPVESSVGWHIIQRISYPGIRPFQEIKRSLQAKIEGDGRYEQAKTAMIDRIKKESGFQVNEEAWQTFMDSLDNNFLSHRWTKPSFENNAVLISLGEQTEYRLEDFAEYCRRSTRSRLRYGSNRTPGEVARNLYEEFVGEVCMTYEEKQLERKYPDFKALMREYEEGILLFEATKILVWDKASQDTAGLRQYYDRVKAKYLWRERARVMEYRVLPEGVAELKKIMKLADKKPAAEVKARFNTGGAVLLNAEENLYEKGKEMLLDIDHWKVGALTEVRDNKDGSKTFMKVLEILPPQEKKLQEARGYVVADYQDHLERQWIESLRKDYEVEVNEEVFQNMIRY